MKIIKITDCEYPIKLKKLKNPPEFIYVEGDYSLLNKNSIAIVGSRDCSRYGYEQSLYLSEKISKQGICVVSGLARGIDTAAHFGSFKNIGKTVAVLGCGINNIYPEENKDLVENILSNGGCVISECDIDCKAVLKNFPKRNRIIAGLVSGTIVVEAKYRSGSLVTARLTNELNKPIFCIPGDLDKKQSWGTNMLIKSYGTIITEVEDVFKTLEWSYNEKVAIKKEKKKKENCIEVVKKRKVCKEYEPVYGVLNNEPLSINDIYKKSGLNINEVNQILTMLELEGYIKEVAGRMYILC